MHRAGCWILIGLAAAIVARETQGAAPAYPTKPIRIIVGFPPAGAADIFARLVGQKLSDAWGHPVVIDNRPGAGSTIGSEIAAHATPDGHTLLAVSASFATSAGLYRKLNYHPVDSFTPITLIASNTNVLLGHPSLKPRTTRELVDLARATPGKLTMGSAGTGSITHLAGELFASMAGIKVTHIPYKGAGPNLTALLAAEIQISVASFPAALGHIKAGRLRAFGVTSVKRSPVLPDLPTVEESGVPGYEANNWYGFLAPAGVPKAVVAKLNEEINRNLRAPDFVDAVARQGGEIEGGSSDAFRKYLQSEIAKWTRVIRQAGITL